METKPIELPVKGMDCADCAATVERAIQRVEGVGSVQVFLTSEKALIQPQSGKQVDLESVRSAVTSAGYQPGDILQTANRAARPEPAVRPLSLLALLGFIFAGVLFVVVAGEWLGLFEALSARVPWYAGLAVVLLGGLPVFMKVIRAALQGKIISHTLMTLGVLAALAVGQWTTAAIVVFFMRVGDLTERYTTERARQAVKQLASLAPWTARVEVGGEEVERPVEQVAPGEIVVIRPGETIPVDGVVLSGQASINQASLTGEAMPREVGAGAPVYAATIAQLGSLRLRATAVGRDTSYGRMLRLVEEAEASRGSFQRMADRFSGYFLPFVAALALLTLIFRRDPLATAAVLVVACSCSLALATPIAMLASIGRAARSGLLVKGGRYLEALAKADTLLVDKTGTLTLGQPEITAVHMLNGMPEARLLSLAASAERYSEHPLARAVLAYARARSVEILVPSEFTAEPGRGVAATVDGHAVIVEKAAPESQEIPAKWRSGGQPVSLLQVSIDGQPSALLAAADNPRGEAAAAVQRLRGLGITHIELLTGDNAASAALVGAQLDIPFQAGLMPEGKIERVRQLQQAGRVVVMVGDGVNDAPALAQADVGIAMGAGTDIAVESAHVVLLRDDWMLVPEAVEIAQRTMRGVRGNLFFTGVYNLIGLSLAAAGLLPPGLAAAAQSLPDLGILANSSRLIRRSSRPAH